MSPPAGGVRPLEPAPTPERISATAWYVLALLFVVLTFSLIDRNILSILLVPIQQELEVSDTGMGFLIGLAFAVSNAAAGIPLARLADRRSRRSIIAAGMAAWSVLTALQGAARSFAALALARVGVGIGEAAASPAAHSLLSDYFPPRRRATAIAIFTMGGHVGVLLGFSIGGWINEAFGWRAAMVAVGVPGLGVAMLVWASLREPPRGAIEGRSDAIEPEPLADVLRYLWARRSFRHLLAALPLFVFAAYAINVWGPAFLIRSHGMSTGQAGLSLGVVVGVAGGTGSLAGAYVADRLGASDPRWYMRAPALCSLASIPFGIGFLFAPDPRWALASLAPMVFLGSWYLAPLYAVTQSVARLRMRATASAVVHLCSSVLAAGVGPQLIGILNDGLAARLGPGAVRYSLMLIVVTNAWGALHAWVSAGALPGDLQEAAQLDRAARGSAAAAT